VTAAGIQVVLTVLHQLVCDILHKCYIVTVETMAVEEQCFEGSCVSSLL